jgi:hypothetical protein
VKSALYYEDDHGGTLRALDVSPARRLHWPVASNPRETTGMKSSAIRRAATAALSLTAVLSLAGCGADQSSPDGLGEAVADAANSEDIEAIQDLACSKDKASFKTDFDFDKMRTQLGAEGLSFDVEFVKSETKGNTATLTFKTTFENLPKKLQDMGMPNATENKQNAIQEGDTWVICN